MPNQLLNIDFGIVFFIDRDRGFFYLNKTLIKFNSTADIPAGNVLFWTNYSGYDLSKNGLKDSRFIKDNFFEMRMVLILKEFGLDIKGFVSKESSSQDNLELSFSLLYDILTGVVAFANKFLLVGDVAKQLSVIDIFSYDSFAQATYACATNDINLINVKKAISDIGSNSAELLPDAIAACSRSWISTEEHPDAPRRDELQTKPVVFNQQRQLFVNFLIKESIPSGNWQKVPLSEFDDPIEYVKENQAKGKAMFCRVNFKRTSPIISRLLAFGGIKNNNNFLGSTMFNWLTGLELIALKDHLEDYQISDILIADATVAHPLFSLYQKIQDECNAPGNGWSLSFLPGFIEMHLLEAINKEYYINGKSSKSAAGAYLNSLIKLKTLLSALQSSSSGELQELKVDSWWVFAYGMGRIVIRVPKLNESITPDNFDDRVSRVAQKSFLSPPILNCQTFEHVKKPEQNSVELIHAYMCSMGYLDKLIIMNKNILLKLEGK